MRYYGNNICPDEQTKMAYGHSKNNAFDDDVGW